MARYFVANRETGTRIAEVWTYRQAEELVKKFEEEDKRDGNFVEDFYEIDMDEEDSDLTVEGLIALLKEMNPRAKVYLGVNGHTADRIGAYDNGNYIYICDNCYYEEFDE